MNSTFLRSVVVVSVCGLLAGILELFHQGMPPLVTGFLPTIAYFAQALSLYVASAAGVGFVSGFILFVLSRLTGGKLPQRFFRDSLPVGVFLLVYFTLAGGIHARITPGLDPLPAGSLSQKGVYLLLIVLCFFVVLEGYLLGPSRREKTGALIDTARGFSLLLVLCSLCVGVSEAVRVPVGGGESPWQEKNEKRPVVVFGIDGASWEIVMPLVKAGLMPNLGALMEKGAYGNFRTVGPPLSSAIWTDMATGKDRLKHGITGNVVVQEGEYLALPPRSYQRKVPAVWNILSQAEKKVAVANWRVTYPPEEVNGVIASMLIFQEEGKVYPPSLEGQIMKITKPQRLQKDQPTERKIEPAEKGPRQIADDFLADLAIEGSVFTFLPQTDEYDFYAYYTHVTDAVQHLFWKFREPERFQGGLWEYAEEKWIPSAENIAQFKGFIDDVHIKVDEILGEVIEKVGGDPVVVVVSDHGQKPAKQPLIFVDSYRLLQLAGLMELDAGGQPIFPRSRLYPLLPMTMTNVSGLALNLKGREKDGWIERGADAEKVVEEARRVLQSIRTVETGEPLFTFVKGMGEVGEEYESLKDRIDILLKCNLQAFGKDFHFQIGDSVYSVSEFTEVRGISGTHTNLGIFLISSPRFRSGVLLPALNTMSARVMRSWMRQSKGRVRRSLVKGCDLFNLNEEIETLDLTPTLLYQFDLPVGRDMDGKVPIRLVKDEALDEHRLAFIDSYDDITVKRGKVEESEVADDEMDMLKALGYIK